MCSAVVLLQAQRHALLGACAPLHFAGSDIELEQEVATGDPRMHPCALSHHNPQTPQHRVWTRMKIIQLEINLENNSVSAGQQQDALAIGLNSLAQCPCAVSPLYGVNAFGWVVSPGLGIFSLTVTAATQC